MMDEVKLTDRGIVAVIAASLAAVALIIWASLTPEWFAVIVSLSN